MNHRSVRGKSGNCRKDRIHRNNRAQIAAFGLPRYAFRMAILSDRWIREQAQQHGMIEPFVEAQRRENCISYGLSSYGYDARVAD